MSGYFGGYIQKKQKIGQYELKKSISTLSLLQQKLNERNLQSASHQLAHLINRNFTTLESKGMLRSGTEEFSLAAGHVPLDNMAAEFLRTFRHVDFYGKMFVAQIEKVSQGDQSITLKTLLPKAGYFGLSMDVVSMYGFRPRHEAVWHLSPLEFVQWVNVCRLEPPGRHYDWTTLTAEGRAKVSARSTPLIPGRDFTQTQTSLEI